MGSERQKEASIPQNPYEDDELIYRELFGTTEAVLGDFLNRTQDDMEHLTAIYDEGNDREKILVGYRSFTLGEFTNVYSRLREKHNKIVKSEGWEEAVTVPNVSQEAALNFLRTKVDDGYVDELEPHLDANTNVPILRFQILSATEYN